MCWKCGSTIEKGTLISRTSECPVCGKDLHSCKNCKFYSPGSHYDCHETIDELVKDKEKANFCDSFSVRFDFSVSGAGNASNSAASDDNSDFSCNAAQKARNAAAVLFGESSESCADSPDKARDAFNSLFGSLVCL
ncbi:MAG: hypothetical protein K5640_02190 [Treponema sp.]|nr:hypothetical protein [Treponema sp.]